MKIAVNGLSLVPGRVGGGETYLKNLVRAMAGQLRPGEGMVLLVTRDNRELFDAVGANVERFVVPVAGRRRATRLLVEHFGLPFLLPTRWPARVSSTSGSWCRCRPGGRS